jgi:SNF2 family DNA or RNA helicase
VLPGLIASIATWSLIMAELVLRDYQQVAVDKLSLVEAAGIFDEMGTGKTVMAIALDLIRRKSYNGKTLIVTLGGPMFDHWSAHFERYAPHLRVVQLDPKRRASSWSTFRGVPPGDVYIVHWEALRLMPELLEITWLHVIADEVHRIMHRQNAMTKSMKKIKTYFKLGLSGTPSSGRPDLLWSILNWMYPKQFRSYWKFFERYVNYSNIPGQSWKQITGPKNEAELQAIIEPFTIRRLKKQVLPHLKVMPPDIRYVKLSAQERRAYDQMRDDMVTWVRDQRSQSDEIAPVIAQAIVTKIMRLRQFASAYAEVLPDNTVRMAEPSAKIDACMQLIEQSLDEDKKIVVFSAFKQLVWLLNDRLAAKKIDVATVHGDIPKPERLEHVKRFQNGDTMVFTGSIKAGGTGIDLFASSHLVFLSEEWSPIENNQAVGRLDRIGQTEPVQVTKLFGENTADRENSDKVTTKWSWVEKLLGDDKHADE